MGSTGNSEQWDQVATLLAESHTVIAPDLLGHGQSAKPRGDSLGAYAASIRDLLIALDHRRATVVGHSLGGGVAMQFSYEYPVFCERLALVSSGGLGPEVHPLPAGFRSGPVQRGPTLRCYVTSPGGRASREGSVRTSRRVGLLEDLWL